MTQRMPCGASITAALLALTACGGAAGDAVPEAPAAASPADSGDVAANSAATTNVDEPVSETMTQGPVKIDEPPPDPSIAPRPFTGQQIHDATRVGRTYRFRTQAKDQPPHIVQIRFTKVDENGVTTEITALSEDGKVVQPPKSKDATWADLLGHASYPKDNTVISSTVIDVPAGNFACKVYQVTEVVDGDKRVTKSFFADDLPGAPVMVIEQSATTGKILNQMELVEHIKGD